MCIYVRIISIKFACSPSPPKVLDITLDKTPPNVQGIWRTVQKVSSLGIGLPSYWSLGITHRFLVYPLQLTDIRPY